eukprot:s935_g32.t1
MAPGDGGSYYAQHRNMDVLGVYQFTMAHSKQRLADRARVWQEIDACLHSLPRRNVLLLAGDFNCSLPCSPSYTGPEEFFWRSVKTKGAGHPDRDLFMQLLRHHGLNALNSHKPQLGPSYVKGDHCSRIDFALTRKQFADGVAQDISYCWTAPFVSTDQEGHVPMVGRLLKFWIPPKWDSTNAGISYQQRLQGRAACRSDSVDWQQFVLDSGQQLQRCLAKAIASETEQTDLIPELHRIASTFDSETDLPVVFFCCHSTCTDDVKSYMLHGMPQCKFCMRKFSTWRSFTTHVQRGCQVIHPGPFLGRDALPRAVAVRVPAFFSEVMEADFAVRGSAMLQASDLRNLRQQEWGSRLLTIIGSRHWHHLSRETDMCLYLSRRCVLCDQFVGRAQSMHQHIQQEHSMYWPYVLAKSQQLSNLHAGDSPCPYCQCVVFRTHHCNTWTQVALLLVYGAGQAADVRISNVALRCEICSEALPNAEVLHEHMMTQHKLVSTTYNVARDSVAGEPACSHCGALFDALETLRSHINQGRCKKFCPHAPCESLELLDVWKDACVGGKLEMTLCDAHIRLRLTLHCQSCACRYTRAQDLAGHLQAAHPALWSAAQELTLLLVDLVYKDGVCQCNPSISLHRANHVCLPLRQLAMQYMRIPDALFFPTTLTDTALGLMFAHITDRPGCFAIEQALTVPDLPALWTDSTILGMLRSRCLICDETMMPAELTAHLHEAHGPMSAFTSFYQRLLIAKMLKCNGLDYKCYACLQIFNLPASSDSDLSQRTQLVQAHLRSCPCLLQIAVILNLAAHGGSGHGSSRLGCLPTGACDVSAPSSNFGTGAAGQEPEPCSESRTCQTTKKRRTSAGAPKAAASRSSSTSAAGPHSVTAGQTDRANRQGAAASETRGHLDLLFEQQRAHSLLASTDSGHRKVVSADPGITDLTGDAPETALSAGSAQLVADQSGGSGQGRGHLETHHGGPGAKVDPAGSQFPVSGMGCPEAGGQAFAETSSEPEAHAHDPQRASRTCHGREPHPTLSCVTEPSQIEHHDMALADELSEARALGAHGDPCPEQRLGPDGGFNEKTQSAAEPLSSATPTGGRPAEWEIQGKHKGKGSNKQQMKTET